MYVFPASAEQSKLHYERLKTTLEGQVLQCLRGRSQPYDVYLYLTVRPGPADAPEQEAAAAHAGRPFYVRAAGGCTDKDKDHDGGLYFYSCKLLVRCLYKRDSR